MPSASVRLSPIPCVPSETPNGSCYYSRACPTFQVRRHACLRGDSPKQRERDWLRRSYSPKMVRRFFFDTTEHIFPTFVLLCRSGADYVDRIYPRSHPDLRAPQHGERIPPNTHSKNVVRFSYIEIVMPKSSLRVLLEVYVVFT